MKLIKSTCLILLITTFAVSQDSAEVTLNARQVKPFYFLLDVNGLGFGYSVHRNVDIQATSLLFTSSANLKVYLTNNNSAPFVGLGVGQVFQSLGGSGEGNDWSVAYFGWQIQPFSNRGLFFAAMYQYPLRNRNKKSDYPPMFSFNLGIHFI